MTNLRASSGDFGIRRNWDSKDARIACGRFAESVIAVHISNNTLDLSPVVAALAKEFGMAAVRGTTLSLKSYLWTSDWILLSHNAASLDVAELKPQEIPFPAGKKPILWTDDYSNLWRVLR